MKVAVISHDIAWGDKDENIITIAELLNRVEKDCDLVVLPELFSTGHVADIEQLSDMAESKDGAAIVNLQRWAQFFGFALCGSFVAKVNGRYYNRAFFVEPSGDITYYDKTHKSISGNSEICYTLGDKLPTIIRYRGWNIAMLVSNDVFNPILSCNSSKDIDLMLIPSSWSKDDAYKWKHILIGRAIENKIYIVGANRIGKDDFKDYNTPSYIFNFSGEDIANIKDGILYSKIDKELLLKYRQQNLII